MASSQLMGSNLPSPRLPTRFMGCVRRSGWFSQRRIERPRRQARAWKSASPVSSVSMYTTLPSRTCHLNTQQPPQFTLHWLQTICSSPSAWAVSTPWPNRESAATAVPPAAASAPSAPVVFTNVRRLRLGMMSVICSPLSLLPSRLFPYPRVPSELAKQRRTPMRISCRKTPRARAE